MDKKITEISHYDWLELNFPVFCRNIGHSEIWEQNKGIIVAHGDKCSSYKDKWVKHNIPFHHGVAIYLLSHCKPFSDEIRDNNGCSYKIDEWVIDAYPKFKDKLPSPYLKRILSDHWIRSNRVMVIDITFMPDNYDGIVYLEENFKDVSISKCNMQIMNVNNIRILTIIIPEYAWRD